jgi:hypothetical protein
MNDIKLCTIGEKLVLLRLWTKITTSGFLGLDARCSPCFYYLLLIQNYAHWRIPCPLLHCQTKSCVLTSGGQNDDFRPLTYTIGGRGMGSYLQVSMPTSGSNSVLSRYDSAASNMIQCFYSSA